MSENEEQKKKLQKDAKILLVIAGLFTIAIGLSNTFVNVYIWRLKGDFLIIGIFNLFIHLFLPLTFILAGYLSKKIDGTITLRLGVVFHALFFILILFLRERTANYLIPLGSFLGIAAGFYWLSFQVLSFDLTNDMNRDTYNSYNGIVGSLSGMLAPLVAGLIINELADLRGYYLVFAISFVIFIIIILISTMLHTHKFDEKFKLISTLKQSSISWNSILTANFFYGIRNGILIFLINLLIFIVAKNELSIGKLTLMGGLISTLSFETIEKVMKPEKRKYFLTLGSIMMFIAVGSLILKISYIHIIIYIIINSFFTPFFHVPFSSATYNLIDKSKHQNERIEFIISKELSLNLGTYLRILGYSIAEMN